MNASADISVQQVKLLINGEWVESKTTEWQDIVNPATHSQVDRRSLAKRQS